MGIITLEDVIEELIGEEIVDETDQYVDVHRRIAVARARLASMKHSASEPVPTQHEKDEMKGVRTGGKIPSFITLRSHSLPDAPNRTVEPLPTFKSTTRTISPELKVQCV